MLERHVHAPRLTRPVTAVVLYAVVASVLWWIGRPSVLDLWTAVRQDGDAMQGWPLERLVVVVACCLLVLTAALMLVSAALTVLVAFVALRIPAVRALERVTGPQCWRSAVLTLFGVSLLVSGPAATAEDAGSGGRSVREDSVANPLAGLPYPDLPATGRYVRNPAAVAPGGVVVVRPGDSLWLIATDRLGARSGDGAVACEVDRLYAANRGVIGGDPDLILPGTRLVTTRRHR